MSTERRNVRQYLMPGVRYMRLLLATVILFVGVLVMVPQSTARAAENTAATEDTATAGDAAIATMELSDTQAVSFTPLGVNEAVQAENGYFYFFDENGSVDYTPGWKKPSNSLHLYVGEDGYVTYNFKSSGNTWTAYEYSPDAKDMVVMRSKWLNKEGNQYYFASSGLATIVSYSGEKCYKYESGKWNQLKNASCTLMDGEQYYFNAGGRGVTKEGWVKITETQHLYIGSEGCITQMIKKPSGIWQLYQYDSGSRKWNPQTNVWKNIYSNLYYFNESGYASRVYYGNTQTYYNYTGGKYVLAVNGACAMNNGKLYFFGSNGVRVTKEGWYNLSDNKKLYVSSNGYIGYMMNRSNGIWKLYSYSTGKAVLQISQWKAVGGDKYFFNKNGDSTRIYYAGARNCYDYTNGKWVMAKNTTKSIFDKTYYFNSAGKLVTKAGWYTLGKYSQVYVDARGYVTDSQTIGAYTIDLGGGKTSTVYGYYDKEMADEIIALLNSYRASKGLSTLVKSNDLTASANVRAYETTCYFDHIRPNGSMCFTLSDAMYAENIAAGYSDASAVMTAWKNSSGHNANMLGEGYRTIGVSVFKVLSGDKEGYGIYFVQNFGY